MDANELRAMSRLQNVDDNELAEGIRSAIFTLMDRHEKGEGSIHQGEPCGMNRIGLIAWFAHSLGINRAHADKLLAAIQMYDEDCKCGSPTLEERHFNNHPAEAEHGSDENEG